MLAAVPRAQLEAIIARVGIPQPGGDASPGTGGDLSRRLLSRVRPPVVTLSYGTRPDSTVTEVLRGTDDKGEETRSHADPEPLPPYIERLLYKAAADAEFADKLLRERSAAAQSIGLPLKAAEAAALNSTANAQLAAAIEATRKRSRTESVHQKFQRVAMSRGIQPDRPAP